MCSLTGQEKIDKYRAGYAALDVRKAFLPAVVSTSGRIHGDLLRLLYLLADNKTKRHFRDLDEVIDVDSEAYCWRRSGFFWRMRASLGLACAQAIEASSLPVWLEKDSEFHASVSGRPPSDPSSDEYE